jgi:hypothetical protein
MNEYADNAVILYDMPKQKDINVKDRIHWDWF